MCVTSEVIVIFYIFSIFKCCDYASKFGKYFWAFCKYISQQLYSFSKFTDNICKSLIFVYSKVVITNLVICIIYDTVTVHQSCFYQPCLYQLARLNVLIYVLVTTWNVLAELFTTQHVSVLQRLELKRSYV